MVLTDDTVKSFSLKYPNEESYSNVSDALVKAVFEIKTGVSITKQYKVLRICLCEYCLFMRPSRSRRYS